MKFHHIAISTMDIEKSIKFYTGVLGFKITKEWGEGTGRIVMVESDEGACLELFANGTTLLPEGTVKHIALQVDDTRALLEKVRKAGMEITIEPKDVDIPSNPPMPVTLAFFKGPDGEIIEFFQYR